MKVLLCGDYSGVHHELSLALKLKGVDVKVLSDGDGYKKIKSDMLIHKRKARVKKRNVFSKIVFVLFDLIGVYGLLGYLKTIKNLNLEQYDVIQIINPVVVEEFGAIGNYLFLRHLRLKSKKIYLCALGDDMRWVGACLKKKYKYSPLSKLSVRNSIGYYGSIRYVLSPAYVFLSMYAEKIAEGIITSLEDYNIAYKGHRKSVYFVSLPISKEKFLNPELFFESEKITIFHAWQKGKELKKGNDILDAAMRIIIGKYGKNKINYIVASNIPYDDFVEAYKTSDIILDQVFSYDCGMTASLGMCAGKVVFSGFELKKILNDNVPKVIKENGVNAVSDINKLVEALSYLIENPIALHEIKNNAYDYAVKRFSSDIVANEYLKIWRKK